MGSANRILVAGAGPVGAIAALAFADSGFDVTLLGPRAGEGDRRTTALMTPSLNLMGRLGLLDEIAAGAAPLNAMRIVDGTSRLVRAPTVTFRASEIGELYFGLNIPNAHLFEVLERAVAAQPAIERHERLIAGWEIGRDGIAAVLDDGAHIEGTLAAAADGRNSRAREAAGISARRSDLPQAALVANIGHTIDHGHISTEFHTETGPFTQVPLPGRRSSIVWVLKPADAKELAGLGDEVLAARIEARMQSMLGRVTVEPGRQVYPLSTLTPARFARNRVALVGEAAHVFPPIGAQGLNLGIRDVEDLVAVAAEYSADPGADNAMSAYDRRRRPDILARAGAVNMLNRSLLTGMLPAQLARAAGLAALDAFAPLRGFFMREGLRPGSGFATLKLERPL